MNGGYNDNSNESHAFIRRVDVARAGLTVAVKDIIDVAGLPTTAGSVVLAGTARAEVHDASCLKGIRAAGATIVGKTNLNELAFGTDGLNSGFGTPVNPLGRDLVPGGSSSGNAVALALGDCRIAVGTDTGGSVRIPAACCGVVGLKPTFGQISMKGVRPLAPTLDTVGPMASNVDDVDLAMQLLWDGYSQSDEVPTRLGRLRLEDTANAVESAVDQALDLAKVHAIDVDISTAEWDEAVSALNDILWAEAAHSNRRLRKRWSDLEVGEQLEEGLAISRDARRIGGARRVRTHWRRRLRAVVHSHGIICTPTLPAVVPTFEQLESDQPRLSRLTSPVNLAGLPAIVLPVPTPGHSLPSSLQLVGPARSEGVLVSMARNIERAIGDWRN